MARFGDRYENCGTAVNKWYEENNGYEGSSTFDICDKCVVERGDELLTKGIGEVKPYGTNEPVGDHLGGTVERPPYSDLVENGRFIRYIPYDGDSWYKCNACNIRLVDRWDDSRHSEPYYCFDENKWKIEKIHNMYNLERGFKS